MKRPPRLVARTLAVTFTTAAIILSLVFIVLMVDARDRVRAAEVDKLAAAERVFTALDTRRQQEELAAIATMAENPTLKAALDTYFTESRFAGLPIDHERALRETVAVEAAKLAAVTGADVLAIADTDGRVFASAGPSAAEWPAGEALLERPVLAPFRDIASIPHGVYRVAGAPLRLIDREIGALVVGTRLDVNYARELAGLASADVVIAIDRAVVASTAPPDVAADLVRVSGNPVGIRMLDGEEYAIRTLVASGPARVLTLASIDAAARTATRDALMALGTLAFGAFVLAALGSLWLARTLTDPIDRLLAEIAVITAARDLRRPLHLTGTSRELDALATAFNDLVRGVTAAEAESRSAYVGAIRALAAALDARDPYTAGHSERVSALAVLIGRHMGLDPAGLDVLRLGALLHDIGKIGVSDDILRKPAALTADEYEQLKRHPGLGARILRQVPFLEPHIPIVELHHERPDGRGYPFGLRGDEIPVAARIVHVADAFDAITSARAYRPARGAAEAVVELQRCTGTEFDATCVDALVAVLPLSSDAPEPALQELLGRGIAGALAALLVMVTPAIAQQARPSILAVDTALSIDGSLDANGNDATGVFIDGLASVGLGRGIEALAWPMVMRFPTGEWYKDLWIAAARYERPGPIGVRVDAGLIPSPIGLANLTVRRPHRNPLISQPVSLFMPLPPFELRGPRANLLGGIYPIGVHATVSGAHWDARAAIIDTSPLRRRRVLSDVNPPRFANVVVGGGVTPFVGLRAGGSVTHGGWARAGESPVVTADHDATIITVEAELSFAYTSLAGEWTRDVVGTGGGTQVASGWFVVGQQTLTPRWFAAARVERISSPVVLAAGPVRQTFAGTEEVLGYRLTPDLTIRAAHRARRGFGFDGYAHQAAVSLVFWKRWR